MLSPDHMLSNGHGDDDGVDIRLEDVGMPLTVNITFFFFWTKMVIRRAVLFVWL